MKVELADVLTVHGIQIHCFSIQISQVISTLLYDGVTQILALF